MKKLLLLIPFACCGLLANAQITITMADLASGGSMIYQSNDTTPTISVGSTGASQTWNMVALSTDFVDTLNFSNPTWVPDDTTFPASNLVLSFGTNQQYGYLTKNSSGLSLLGNIADNVDIGTGTPTRIVQTNTPAEMLITFPSTYNTSFNSNLTTQAQFYYGQDPGVGVTVDSIRYKSDISKTVLCDAWGNLSTPLGTFAVLRYNELKYQTDSAFGYVNGFGWIFFQEQRDTIVKYTWWSNNIGFPLVEAEMTGLTASVETVKWLQALPAVGIDENSALSARLAYPNPASSLISINTGGAALLEVFDMSGRLVGSETVTKDITQLNLDNYANGLYTYSLSSKEKVKVAQGKFTVAK
jgi:hypothetical protein